jgi:hypothetical protein
MKNRLAVKIAMIIKSLRLSWSRVLKKKLLPVPDAGLRSKILLLVRLIISSINALDTSFCKVSQLV